MLWKIFACCLGLTVCSIVFMFRACLLSRHVVFLLVLRGWFKPLQLCVRLLHVWSSSERRRMWCLNVLFIPYLSWSLLPYFSLCVPSFAPLPSSTFLITVMPPSSDAKHRAESELGPQTRPRSNTLPKSFGSTLDQGAHDAVEVKGPRPTREETLELIQRRVKGKRQEDGWPDDIKVRYSLVSHLIYSCLNVSLDMRGNWSDYGGRGSNVKATNENKADLCSQPCFKSIFVLHRVSG